MEKQQEKIYPVVCLIILIFCAMYLYVNYDMVIEVFFGGPDYL